MTHSRNFLKGFLIGLSVFVLANVLAAHLFSDCGLPALLGLSACADDISRLGFPFVFFKQGGYAYHSDFNPIPLTLDLIFGIGVSAFLGFYTNKKKHLND